LQALLARHRFARAIDVAHRLNAQAQQLPVFDVTAGAPKIADELLSRTIG
jgi:hypothetical protein